jgi:hypothetical protein
LVESWDDIWLTSDVEYCWAGIMNSTNPSWVSWRFWKFIITILRNIKYPFFMYNPWSTKKFELVKWPPVLLWNLAVLSRFCYIQKRRFSGSEAFEKPVCYLAKSKFAPDTDIGRHERHAGGRQWNNDRFLGSRLYTEEICGCVERVGVGGHSTQSTFTCTKLLAINCEPTHDAVHINS